MWETGFTLHSFENTLQHYRCSVFYITFFRGGKNSFNPSIKRKNVLFKKLLFTNLHYVFEEELDHHLCQTLLYVLNFSYVFISFLLSYYLTFLLFNDSLT